MFRRRTDHIYATLQQVQRRVTQKGGATDASSQSAGGISAGGSSHLDIGGGDSAGYMIHPDGRRERVGSRTGSQVPTSASHVPAVAAGQAVATSEELLPDDMDGSGEPQTEAYMGPPSTQSLPKARGMFLSPELASVLALIWICSATAAYLIGFSHGNTEPADQHQVLDQRPRYRPMPRPGTKSGGGTGNLLQSGSFLVIIDSVGSQDVAKQRPYYEEWRKRLNPWAAGLGSGFNEYFGLRSPSRGGLQFVYGMVDGQPGISKTEAEEMLKILQTNQPQRFAKSYVLDLGN